jgi:hypothetical protein
MHRRVRIAGKILRLVGISSPKTPSPNQGDESNPPLLAHLHSAGGEVRQLVCLTSFRATQLRKVVPTNRLCETIGTQHLSAHAHKYLIL